ncbi:MAG: S49 family peptidase [Gammaproteobacteria bacterium]|nr:S49 family peptidase [Gammaproteobacteria bacterium]MBU1625110.1 S49 family peptidase [Gammaproteobacteria bacterium]MBU1981370.1 S49 family peptidase [Gammaproteobacteria bacterium]
MSELGDNWERNVLEKLAMSAIQEQRRTRRWGIFFKLLTFAYLFFLFAMVADLVGNDGDGLASGKHTALIEVRGVIAADSMANADNLIGSLQDAYKDKNTAGIILRVNSPGGSPVQAGLVNDEIKRQRALHPEIPLHVVVEDMCASGGYFIAAAADNIYVNKASIVGSIGVLMDGFGFTGTMQKLGVERRLMTAGENKGFMDPFSPRNPKHEAFTKSLLEDIHQQFITVVRDGRGKRLHETPEMFSGLFWTGDKAIQMGLADGIGSVDSVARDIIKTERVVDFSAHENIADRLAKKLGAGVASMFPGFGAQSEGVTLR